MRTSYLESERTAKIIIAALVKKLGGSVIITQDDLNVVAYTVLHETQLEDATLQLTLKEKTRQ